MSAQTFVQTHPEGSAITVWVVPGARRTELVGVHGDAVKIRVAAPPEGGKANRAVAAVLTGVTGAAAELLRGASARRKVFVLVGVAPEAVARAIELGRGQGDR